LRNHFGSHIFKMNLNGVEFYDQPQDFIAARRAWLELHLGMVGELEPIYACGILLLESATTPLDWVVIEFEEYEDDGLLCAGRNSRTGAWAFGNTATVIAGVTAREASDPWVRRVVQSLDAERKRAGRAWRRGQIEVVKGNGELAHATSRQNRESIQAHGLDWRLMGDARGIAGSATPEVEGIYLVEIEAVSFFTAMPEIDPDVWIVDAEGIWLETGPEGFLHASEPIPSNRIRLADRREIPGYDESRTRHHR
jgi:hypothetical protein